MNRSLLPNKSKWALVALDCLFVLFLFTEVAFAHSRAGQAALLLFAGAALLVAFLDRRVPISFWLLFYLAFCAWGALCLLWAVRFSTAFAMLRTLGINLIFLAALLQYFTRRDFSRIALLYLIAIGAFAVYVAAFSDPLDAMTRFGWDVGVNPNAAGMVTAFACGLSLYLATGSPKKRGQALYLLPALLFLTVTVLTGSIKAMLVVAGIMALYLMLRYPKRAWVLPVLGLAVLAGMYALSKSRLMYEVPFFYKGYFHDIVWKRFEGLFLYLESGQTEVFETAAERGSLLSVGLDAIRRRPLTGYGLDCFQHLTDAAGVPVGTYSHNNYIELLVSGGVPLLLLHYAPILALLVMGVRRMRGRAEVKMALTLLVAVLVADLAVVSYYDRTLLMIPALLAAVTWQGKQKSGAGPLSWIELG